MAGTIQSSINQSMASVAGLLGIGKIAKEKEKTNEALGKAQETLAKYLDKDIEGAKERATHSEIEEDLEKHYDEETEALIKRGFKPEKSAFGDETLPLSRHEERIMKAVKASHESLTAEELSNAVRKMAIKERAEFLKQGQHYQSQTKREEQHKLYEEGRK